ncbi:uncharacterized protein SCHCODRAFT_02753922 [Schizophyllum commune H4-8]|nr:uncharacterized protein SCHCODRAFT_02753922 [Schizophyllum commune H4-8]KAI5884851.1 hypothetical protein SCHCODRAFT_02753922 [Schizophyllum commune H4-8]
MPPKKATTKCNVKSPRTKKRSDLKNLKFYEHTTEQKAVKHMAALLHRKPKYGWPTDEELAIVQSSLLPPPTPMGLRPYATDALLSDAAMCVDDTSSDWSRSCGTGCSEFSTDDVYSPSYSPTLEDFDMPSACPFAPLPLSLEVDFESAPLDDSAGPATTTNASKPESRVQYCEWAHRDDSTHNPCGFCLNTLFADANLRSRISDHLSQSGLEADFVGGKSSWYRCRWKNCDNSHYETFLFDDLVEHVLHSHYKT